MASACYVTVETDSVETVVVHESSLLSSAPSLNEVVVEAESGSCVIEYAMPVIELVGEPVTVVVEHEVNELVVATTSATGTVVVGGGGGGVADQRVETGASDPPATITTDAYVWIDSRDGTTWARFGTEWVQLGKTLTPIDDDVTLGWDTANARLQTVAYDYGETLTLNYDTDGRLAVIDTTEDTDPYATLTYGTDGYLTRVVYGVD